VGLSEVEANLAWAEALAYEYEVWSEPDGVLVQHYDAWSEFDDAPMRHAFLHDAEGKAIMRYEGAVSVGASPVEILADARLLFGE
jgi:hypothetical protein